MKKTILNLQDNLPLTCSRKGICCFGKQVLLNPWELATMAETKKLTLEDFIQNYCEFNGARLLFNGISSAKGEKACSQYIDGFGCSVHVGRPLVCRLYPIGRTVQNAEKQYIYEGSVFPCLDGCSEVTSLPYLTIEEYLAGQQTEKFEAAQDLYLELLQGIADMAFTILFESGLHDFDIQDTIQVWKKLQSQDIETLSSGIEKFWMNLILKPEIEYTPNETAFIQQHAAYIQSNIQELYNDAQNAAKIQNLSAAIFGSALLLAFSLGINFNDLGKHWIHTAESQII